MRGTPRPLPEPSRRVAVRRSRLWRGAIIGFGTGITISIYAVWAIIRKLPGWRNGGSITEAAIAAPVFFSLVGLVLGVAGGLLFGFAGVPDNLAHVASPTSILARDRRATLIVTLIPAISIGTIFGFAIGGTASRIGFGFFLALVVILGVGTELAWLRFVIARELLALRHQLPSRLMSFLADAHQRGVLRQAGAVYQFRHIELQRRLANRWEEPPARRWWQVPINVSSKPTDAGDNTEPPKFSNTEPAQPGES